ncbi:hypothetical protein ITX54_05970 [Rouxiella silvae]|uniref:Uncharacterized protein n=1 Tax=Rouxiella silvae TaxID=1646373 RepID=A0AA41BVH6_9GAMM|nr:hypothetical protein [Rouxiella silvae]MBF6636210.1 hypothetical protein [Rouxiella silvae]
MPGKTQIAELRLQASEVSGDFKVDALINRCIGQLEAAEARIAELEVKAEEVNGWYVKMKSRMLAADAELAKIKGDAVPFGYVEAKSAIKVVKGHTRFAALTMEPKGKKCLPLFTHAQPVPVVVLSDSYTCPRCKRTTTRPNGEHYCHVKSADGEGE